MYGAHWGTHTGSVKSTSDHVSRLVFLFSCPKNPSFKNSLIIHEDKTKQKTCLMMSLYVIKTLSLFLINFSLVFTSQIRLIFKITSPKNSLKGFVFEAVQNTRSTCFIGSKTLGDSRYGCSCFKLYTNHLNFYCIKQIDYMFPCVCTVIDHRRRHNV